jgi:hypothetical protein
LRGGVRFLFSVSSFLEAIVTMFPRDAGGRIGIVEPREGSYRPFLRAEDGSLLRVRFIEGPPSVAPGETARVVAEVESLPPDHIPTGSELDLLETDAATVGFITVARVW